MWIDARAGLAIAFLVSALVPSGLAAQVVIPGDRPGDERQALPPMEPIEVEKRQILPEYPVPKQTDTGEISAGIKVVVREIRITGNRVISTETLDEIAAPYKNRAHSFTDLQKLSDQLTRAYVMRGYVTSGAVLPDQTIRDGIVELQIIEGRLGDIEIETDGRIRPGYIRARLEKSSQQPVNVLEIEERLQLLQQDRRFRRVQAQLVPGEQRGISVLSVQISEEPPYQLGADFNNYHNPTIGSFGGGVRAGYDNALGIGDSILVRGGFTEGLHQVEAVLGVPLNAYDTLLTLRYQGSWAEIVDGDFDKLDIDTQSESFGIELRQPAYRTLRSSMEGFVRGEWRRAESNLGLLNSGLPSLGADNGISKVTVLRFGVDGFHRTRSQVFSGRALVSWGIDALGSSVNPGNVPDSRFVSGLLQLQWARRLPWSDIELVTRFDTQIAGDPLLPLEQFAIGGRYTVRGYRENNLVRDNGLVGGLEARIPVFGRVQPPLRIELVPFFDAGYSWNTDRSEVGQQTLMSLGIGSRVFFTAWGRLEFYWGHRFNNTFRAGERDLQDDGIHFLVSMDWP